MALMRCCNGEVPTSNKSSLSAKAKKQGASDLDAPCFVEIWPCRRISAFRSRIASES